MTVANALVVGGRLNKLNCQGRLLDVVHFPSIKPNAAFTRLDSAISRCTTRQAYTSAADEHAPSTIKSGCWSKLEWRATRQAKTAAAAINPRMKSFIYFLIFFFSCQLTGNINRPNWDWRNKLDCEYELKTNNSNNNRREGARKM